MSIFQRFFGSSNDRKVKAMMARVAKITALEPALQALSDQALRDKTAEFRARLEKGETLDQLLEEAFAVVREATGLARTRNVTLHADTPAEAVAWVDPVAVRRHIGMVFQQPNPLAMSVYRNVSFGLTLNGANTHSALTTATNSSPRS